MNKSPSDEGSSRRHQHKYPKNQGVWIPSCVGCNMTSLGYLYACQETGDGHLLISAPGPGWLGDGRQSAQILGLKYEPLILALTLFFLVWRG